MALKIIKAYPPNYVALTKAFPIKGRKGILYAWEDRIYNPSGVPVPAPLLIHEGVHCVQQTEIGVEQWWKQYIENPEFRFYEEALAHMAEWKTYQENTPEFKDRHAYLQRHLRLIAQRLSSDLYGNLMTFDECMEVITGKKSADKPEGEVILQSAPVDITEATIQ